MLAFVILVVSHVAGFVMAVVVGTKFSLQNRGEMLFSFLSFSYISMLFACSITGFEISIKQRRLTESESVFFCLMGVGIFSFCWFLSYAFRRIKRTFESNRARE